ncbi:dTDP-4-dehydrorhamnose 3,5-epimerase [Pseudomonas juntendi]|uniref:dTDP-4-dehydrorhamnose 3,5-epimerase n=1 Tax=Pseudomonas TaxID=286 RepID=UPI0001FB8BE4|nr:MULTISPECIES: dTDP-4-dehydrorhamnose 3,5-epimerase [Pseudomonas]PPB15717.1 dTDP-4-dehydrorhamnose 3,5-epimerase [Pseudomonas aeruginosa]EGB96102.1 dTDP-4-dehydrorhamnose 3,5-epimerase [Pseudomonas sp. TJI-51]MBA6122371.1 dTDP-4-dehydrorhamnose 3,5-epimerase [Pseudomonas juntendi]MBH3386438.1 dTDP-4-dehydrorhamnose 3,5-epimerase [Pseudomonas juntendi]MCF3157182.1 dTDP-4-dehydrorhamnose 3,5-epimerase [Pseudomonas juntendi]
MQAIALDIPEVVLFTPKVFGDDRGFFYESYNARVFTEVTGLQPDFVQDNHSRSVKGVLRGLHYQLAPHAQGKLVRVIQGEVFDVAVDIRRSSPTFGKWVGAVLSAENKQQLWIPAGFAHGFVTLSETAEFVYKTTDFYSAKSERCIAWDDPQIAIDWRFDGQPQLSGKDQQGVALSLAEVFD